MAEYLIQDSTLAAIADAIRKKTGKTDTIQVSKYAVAIQDISVGDNDTYIKYTIDENTGEIIAASPYGFDIIPTGLFAMMTSLETVDLSNSPNITAIGANTFYGCSGLTSIEIPKSVTSIGDSAFYGCNNLTTVNYNGTLEQWCNNVTTFGTNNTDLTNALVFSNGNGMPVTNAVAWSIYGDNIVGLLDNAGTLSVSGTGNMYNFTSSTTPLKNKLSSIKKITIEAPITSIGNYAFYNLTNVTNVIIPETVTNIGADAFKYCSKLTAITIPDSVTSMGERAFMYSGLKSITIPNGITVLNTHVFSQCSSLTTVVISDSVIEIGYGAFQNSKKITSITIGNNVKTIGVYGFGDFAGTTVVIPDSVEWIQEGAFFAATNLTTITIGSGVKKIDKQVFANCSNLNNATFKNTSGWWYSSSADATSGTTISSSTLSSTYNAARQLYRYRSYYWRRN